jgi:hypothetical protein
MKTIDRIAGTCGLAALLIAQSCPADLISKELKFSEATRSATAKDKLKASDKHRYEFLANPGETLTISVSSKTKNVSFGLYLVSPSLYVGKHNDDGDVSFRDALAAGTKKKPAKGEVPTLPGADSERTKWTGKLPAVSKSPAESGAYAVVVSPKDSDARYVLKLTIEQGAPTGTPGGDGSKK